MGLGTLPLLSRGVETAVLEANPELRRSTWVAHLATGGGEIAVAADDGSEHLRREVAEQMLGVGVWIRSQEFGWRSAHDGADFDGHVEGGSGGTGRGRDLCGDGVGAFG